MPLLHSPPLLFLLPLLLATRPPNWRKISEYNRVCWNPAKYMPFRDGNVYKQCGINNNIGGSIKEFYAGGWMCASLDNEDGSHWRIEGIRPSEGEEVTDVCELKDGMWQWGRGQRPTSEFNQFIRENSICQKHGIDIRFVRLCSCLPIIAVCPSNRYKECKYDKENGGRIETIACKAVNGRTPLDVGDERRDNTRNDVERCTQVGDGVVYEYRPMTNEEIEEKETTLALCKEHGFVNAFVHNGSFQRCESNGRGALSLVNDGSIEICEMSKNGKEREVELKTGKPVEEGRTTSESAEEREEESSSVLPLPPPPTIEEDEQEIIKICDRNGIDIEFFEGNVAKKCISSPDSLNGVIVEIVGCRFAVSDTVVPLGEKIDKWGVSFRCVASQKKEVRLLIEKSPSARTNQPHCELNGKVVPVNSRVIVGGQFEFKCKKRGSRNSSKFTKTELRFLGCIDSEKRREVKETMRRSRLGKTSHVVCDLSSMDPNKIEVIAPPELKFETLR